MPEQKLYIDFSSAKNTYRRAHGGGSGQAIARAIGLKTYGLPLTVIDATAGLGQDAFVLACLGCKVIMIERSPDIANLLADALQRGLAEPEVTVYMRNMELIKGDARDVLQEIHDKSDRFSWLTKSQPDVVYLDPMFPVRDKSALVKKELRLLKDIVGEDLDADQLLELARKVATRRVVVKRPRLAPYLAGVKPHSAQVGRANRFDIYMPMQARH